jgi:signal transduction histidine kinase
MKSPLRWRILLFTALPIVVLVAATMVTVNRSITDQVRAGIEQELVRAAGVFENMLDQRAQQLEIAGQVIVKDPRFFSVLTLPGNHADPFFRNTVLGVAADFNSITHADHFEVFDAAGFSCAEAGRDAAVGGDVAPFVRDALAGRARNGVLATANGHYQVAAAPAFAGGQVVGVVLLGSRIGAPLAGILRDLTRSEVTFFSAGALTASTLARTEDRDAARAFSTRAELHSAQVREVNGRGDTWLTLARSLPGEDPALGQRYALQRSLHAETAFLRSMQRGLLELGLLAVLIAVLAGLVISNQITTPVDRLVRAAEEIERGNYDFPLGARSRDEIGYLADRFDTMRQHERAYVTSLREIARLKSEFIAVASHELRTPISVVHGWVELLLDGVLGPVTGEQKRALDAIDESARALAKIADDATRMAQVDGERLVLHLGDHSVADLLSRATQQILAEARGRRVAVALAVDASLPQIHADGTRIVEAVANLVRNGVRFTPDGGRVEVRATLDVKTIVVAVRDDGIGVPAEKQRQIFERGVVVRDSLNHHSSSTLEFNSAGLGLGLAIARGIIEAHGGTIDCESGGGRGSTFTIRLPQVAAEALVEAA